MMIKRLSLDVTDYQTVALTDGAKILHVAPCRTGAERIDLWFLDPEDWPGVEFSTGIYIVGTGNPMPDRLRPIGLPVPQPRYIGTCVMPSRLVWHVFSGPVVP